MAPLLAFVDIFVESPHMDEVVQALTKLDNIEELYVVTGEFDMVTLVEADDIEEFRDVLKNKIMKIRGVKRTVSSLVLRAQTRSAVSPWKLMTVDSVCRFSSTVAHSPLGDSDGKVPRTTHREDFHPRPEPSR